MKHRRLLLAAPIALLALGCPSPGPTPPASTEDTELRPKLQTWVHTPVTGLHAWHENVWQAICQLEEREHAESPLDNDRRLCRPGGDGGRPADPPAFE